MKDNYKAIIFRPDSEDAQNLNFLASSWRIGTATKIIKESIRRSVEEEKIKQMSV